MVKIDMRHLTESLPRLFEKNEHGKLSRIWGKDDRLTTTAGYDVEKNLWDMILKEDCERTFLVGECDKLRAFYKEAIAA